MTVIEVKSTASPVLLVIVTVWAVPVLPRGWLPNEIEAGDTVSAACSVPLNATVWVPAPSFTVIAADLCPAADGVKVTLIVQDAPIATVVPHVLVSVKLVRLAPVTLMLVMESATLPVLTTLIVLMGLVVFTA